MKNFLRGMIGIVGLVLASSAIAAPTYLTCQVPNGKPFSLTLNEAQGTSASNFGTYQAVFSANSIEWRTPPLLMLSPMTFRLDRSTLELNIHTAVDPDIHGTCKIEAAPDRQI
jgi:hypothetical protein